ncbi:MAG: hypothetical protein ACRDCW_04660 [Sarcina sp.]
MGVYKIIYDKESNKIYEGEFEGEIREGRGSLYYSSGEIKYLGEWKEDVPDGIGVLFYESGMKFYEGEWRKGTASGQGVLFTEDGRREYEGQFANSKKNGIGTIYYEDGSSYQGEWKEDRREGKGSLFYSTGDLQYRGEWENSKKHGEGMLFNRGNILSYQGEFFEDKRQGIGRSYYLDGKVEYDGFWLNNEKSGEGVLYGIDGTKIFEGIFENDQKVIKDEVEHIDEKVEHINKNSLESMGIDVEIYDVQRKNIINNESEIEFLQNSLEEENENYEFREDDNQQNIDSLEVSNEYVNTNFMMESNNLIDKTKLENKEEIRQTELLEEEITSFVLQDIEDDINTEKVVSVSYEEKDNKDIDEEIISEKNAKSIEVEIIDDENEKIIENGTVEVRIEDNKVYKYIEIGDLVYKGEFNEGNRSGYGKIYYKEVLQYEGSIKNGVYDGIGKLYDLAERVEFEGNFKEGKKFGYGTSYDSFGNPIYKGEWKNDIQEGEGELLNSNGEQIYKGKFYKGKALGLGISIENEIDNILYCELESMIGLEEVKDDIARLVSFLKMQILRQRVSYKAMDIPYVFTFEGNIGVGKESVARILGKLYYVLGLVPEYNFIQRDLLTALEYSHDGDIEKSMDNFGGGVLYLSNLYQSNYEDITEVIRNKVSTDNILDLIEYSNGHFIIVFSGEEELIETMIHNKKELAKCVGKSITFFDYSVEEMMDYVLGLSQEKDYILSEDLMLELENFFSDLLENDKYNNRNGEFINELFTELVKEQCIRIDTYGVSDIENLKVLELQDFKNIENKICF